MKNKEIKLWTVSLILTSIACLITVLYIIIGIESLKLIYIQQEGFDALALLVLLPLLILLGLAALVLVIISLITTIKCLKIKYRKKTTILLLVLDSLIILIIIAIFASMYLKNFIN